MASPIQVSVKSDRIQIRLDEMPANVRSRLQTVSEMLESELLAGARARASGIAVNIKSGEFLASIKGSVRSSDRKVTGRVYSKDDRAPLFEWGGSTKARDILPSVAKAMAFMGSAGQTFAAIVHRPVVQYPAKHVIGGAFEEMKGDIQAELTGAVRDAVAGD